MNPHLRRTVAGIGQWTPFARGLEAAETSYQAYGWPAPRRLVVVRATIRERPQARGRKLLAVPGYTFHVLVTTLRHAPVPTWRFYNSRAESDNRIKELKQDFGADGFCLHSFDGTEAAFRLICFLFNLIADFKREVTQNEAPRLLTLRTRLWSSAPSAAPTAASSFCAWVCAGAGANASPRCSSALPRSPFQLWRSSPPTKKILRPSLGNRANPASNPT